MKILISDSVEHSCIDILERESFEVDFEAGMKPEELMRRIAGCDALIVRSSTKVTAEVIGLATRLKVIGRAGAGVDNIDVEAATRRGVLVMNAPGGNTISAAEHTVSMLLSLARNIPQANASLQRGEWDRKRYTGTEVFEKTLGIIGLGKIGREVATRCIGLGMTVIGYDPLLSADVAAKLSVALVTLDELYRRSDFISVHTPLTAETRGLLNDESLARCKRGVRIVNCARGGIVDEQALLRALRSGQVGGAALDVFETEPPANNPLLAHGRVIATPHLGASTEEAQEKVAAQIAHQVADALHGRAYIGVVNASAMHLMLKQELRPYLELAEKLGSLVAQLMNGKLGRVTVTASGDLVASSLELLKAGVLKGILSLGLEESVNFINAPVLAAELGLAVNAFPEHAGDSFSNVLRVQYETDREVKDVAGAVFGTSAVRLVQMDGFRFEVKPEGHLLVYYNMDRPGMLARVGSLLARHNVNIAGVSLGRTAVGAMALTVMNIDSGIPPEAMRELVGLEGVSGVRVIRFD